MADNKQHLDALAQFIHDNRSNEQNFEKLYNKLVAEQKNAAEEASENGNPTYAESIKQALQKGAATYRQNKEKGISTWSEFENFVSQFEKAVTEALKQP